MVEPRYRVIEVARILGVSRQRVHQLRQAYGLGELQDRQWTFSRSDVRRLECRGQARTRTAQAGSEGPRREAT